MHRGGNYDVPRALRQLDARIDYGYQNPPMQQVNTGIPQGYRYPPAPNLNHQYVNQNEPSGSFSRQNDYISQRQFPNSLQEQTHQREAPRVTYDQNISRQGPKRQLLDNIPSEWHQGQLQPPFPASGQYAQNFTAPSNSKFQNQRPVFMDPEVINARTDPRARYKYLPENQTSSQFPQEKELSFIRRPYPEEYLPIEQGIQTPIPIHATPESMGEFENGNLKPGPPETYNYVPGGRRELTSAFKPYNNSRPIREREPAGCREMFHSRQYNERENIHRDDPFDKRLFKNQYHTNTANRDRFIIPIRENSEFESQDKSKLISNKVQVIMQDVDDPSEFNSATDTHKPLETLENADKSLSMEKIKEAQRVAHRFDDASKQIIIPAPSKIKVRTPHKHHKTYQLAGMLNNVAAGSSTFDGNSYLVQSMVGGVDGMNPMHTAYQQQYLYPPVVQPEYQYQYIPQYVAYNQQVPIQNYVPENEYGGTYFQLTGTENQPYNPANAYVQHTYSESDYSGQSSQEDIQNQEQSVPTNNPTDMNEIQAETVSDQSDIPTFDEHDPLGLTRKESPKNTITPKPSMKRAVQLLENGGEELMPILESEVIPSRMPFPDTTERMSVNGTGQNSIKGIDRMSTNGSIRLPGFSSTADIEDDFEDFLLGTASLKPMETGSQKSTAQDDKDLFDLERLFEDDRNERGLIQNESSELEESKGSNIPDSQNTSQVDNQNAILESKTGRENPSSNTNEDKYDDFIAELLGEPTNTDAGKGTANKLTEETSNFEQSGNNVHTAPEGYHHNDEKLSEFDKGKVEVCPVSSNSEPASEDFYNELLEDLLGNTGVEGTASTMPKTEAVDLSSNCEPLKHFDEPPTHNLQDLFKDMGSNVSSILSDILSISK